MRLSVYGSRTSEDDDRVRILIIEAVGQHDVDVIVTHAEPTGVCATARAVAHDLGLPLHFTS